MEFLYQERNGLLAMKIGWKRGRKEEEWLREKYKEEEEEEEEEEEDKK